MLNRDIGDGYEPAANGKAPDHPGSFAVHLAVEADRARERAEAEAAGRRGRSPDAVDRHVAARDGAAQPIAMGGGTMEVEPPDATAARRRADEAQWEESRRRDERRLAEAARKIAETGGGLAPVDRVPPTTAGLALPTPANVAEHAKPEVPRAPGRPAGLPWAERAARAYPPPPPDPGPGTGPPADDRMTALAARLRRCAGLDDAVRELRHHLAHDTGREAWAELQEVDRAERLYEAHYRRYLNGLQDMVRAYMVEMYFMAGLPQYAAALESGDFARLIEEARP